MTKKVDMIVDLQYGSTGKGLIAGYLAVKHKYDLVVNANMPNAGHTFIDARGNKMIHKVLPNGIVSPKCTKVLLGPGSIFDINQLGKEIKAAKKIGYLENAAIYVHHAAVILSPTHVQTETEIMDDIGSTLSGSASAMIHKIMRMSGEENPTVSNPALIGVLDDIGATVITNVEYNLLIKEANNILAEGAQGFSLGINEKFYPFCTSRDCSVSRFLSDMAIPVPYLNKVIGTARTYPIRVGGNSGGCYKDQIEIEWKTINQKPERTTVTNRERRLFTFSYNQILEAMYMMAPDEVFLNFCNYLADEATLTNMIHMFSGKVKYLGHGPAIGDISEI